MKGVPVDVMYMIFQHLDVRSLLDAALVSRAWRKMCRENASWRRHKQRTIEAFPDTVKVFSEHAYTWIAVGHLNAHADDRFLDYFVRACVPYPNIWEHSVRIDRTYMRYRDKMTFTFRRDIYFLITEYEDASKRTVLPLRGPEQFLYAFFINEVAPNRLFLSGLSKPFADELLKMVRNNIS